MEAKDLRGEIITAAKMNDYNDFGQPEKITLNPFKVDKPDNGLLKVDMPAMSVVKLQFSK